MGAGPKFPFTLPPSSDTSMDTAAYGPKPTPDELKVPDGSAEFLQCFENSFPDKSLPLFRILSLTVVVSSLIFMKKWRHPTHLLMRKCCQDCHVQQKACYLNLMSSFLACPWGTYLKDMVTLCQTFQ